MYVRNVTDILRVVQCCCAHAEIKSDLALLLSASSLSTDLEFDHYM